MASEETQESVATLLLQNSTGLESRCAATLFGKTEVLSATPATKSCFSQRCCAVFRTQRCGFNNVVHTSAAKVWFRIFSNSYSKKFFRIEEYRKITGTTNRLHTMLGGNKKFFFSCTALLLPNSCGRVGWLRGFIDSLFYENLIHFLIPRRSTMRNVSAIEQLCCVSGGCTSR